MGADRRDTYVHGTGPAEQERLVRLNRTTNTAFLEFLRLRPGMHVLEVGSGLGILATEVAAMVGDGDVVGVERSPQQLSAARQAPNVRYVQSDAHQLDFPDDTFDLVYARYVLEHVTRPEQVLAEMRRVTRPGGRVAGCENDISLLRIDPPCPAFERVWDAFKRYQVGLGGDPLIGRRLYRLFQHAGLREIELSAQTEVHWHGSPGFDVWIQNVIGNIEGARAGLVESGLCREPEFQQAIEELMNARRRPEASSGFMWNRVVGVK